MAIDKTQLTEDLRRVFITRGYDGATLAHLSASTGLSKASLYHHFPGGKPEMAAVSVRDAISRLQQLAYHHFLNLPPQKALAGFLEGYTEYVDYGRSNCLLAILINHATAHEDILDLQVLITKQFFDWHAILTQAFEGCGYKSKKAERMAHELIAQIHGALLNAKLHNNAKLFSKAMTRLSAQLAT
jgi:TetR/AcrR family transcriptional repressor of lmrAB and yxaGH operons